MSDRELRSKIIRLAHSKPELRKHLLPLVTNKTASLPKLTPSASNAAMKEWTKKAIELYHSGDMKLEQIISPLQQWWDDDIHQAAEMLAGSEKNGKIGMSVKQIIKWYDQNQHRF